MSMDFPASPTVGQSFAPGNGNQYVWDGVAWTAFNQASPAFIADTPPPNPAVGQLWWRSTNGKLYIYTDDGNSKQWVETGNAGATPGAWETIGGGTIDLTGKSLQDVPGLGAYQHLRITVDATLTSVTQAYLRVSDDNGVTFKAGASDYSMSNFVVVNGTATAYAPSPQPQFPLTGSVDSNFIMPTVEISSFNKARAAPIKCDTVFFTNSSAAQRQFPHGYSATNTARNAIRVAVFVGTFGSGSLLVEGVRG